MKNIIYSELNKKIISDWRQLWKTSSYANYFNTPEWFIAALEAFHYKEYRIVCLYKQKQLVAIIPLVKQVKYGFPFYTIPGDYTCGVPFLIEKYNKYTLKQLFNAFEPIGNIFLDEIPVSVAKDIVAFSQTSVTFHCSVNHVLTRETKKETFLVNRSKAMKRVKKIEEKFTLKRVDDIQIALLIDEKSSKQAKGYNIFSDKHIAQFYQILSEKLKKYFFLHVLYFESVPIAYEIGFLINKHYYGNQMAFDSNYRNYSPGKIILIKKIDEWNKENVLTIDFGSGDNEFKRFFASENNILDKVIVAKNPFMRNYIKIIYQSKNYIYKKLTQNIKFYSLYKNIRRKLA